jgi:hypothetical protein
MEFSNKILRKSNEKKKVKKMTKGWDKETARHSAAKKFGKAPPYRTKLKFPKGTYKTVEKIGTTCSLSDVKKELKTEKTMASIKADLAGFTGTQQYHQGWAGVKWTDGVAYFFKKYGGWLITDISSYWVEPKIREEEFQVWTLTINPDKTAILKMTDGNSNKAIRTQKYNYVDLPVGELKFYLAPQPDEQGNVFGVLMLPSEY